MDFEIARSNFDQPGVQSAGIGCGTVRRIWPSKVGFTQSFQKQELHLLLLCLSFKGKMERKARLSLFDMRVKKANMVDWVKLHTNNDAV